MAIYGSALTYADISNNACFSNVVGAGCMVDLGGANCNINYNITPDSTADNYGGTGNLVNKAAVDCFECVDAGAENLDLRYTGACYRKGQDNSALFTTDARGATWAHWETGALVKPYKEFTSYLQSDVIGSY
jgi:hypothetical protein